MKRLLIFIMVVWSLFFLSGCKVGGVVTEDGVGLEGVTLTMAVDAYRTVFSCIKTDVNQVRVTDDDGVYIFDIPEAGTLTITPSLEGYRFEPETVTVPHEEIVRWGCRFDFEAIPDSGVTCHDMPWEGDYLIEDMEDVEGLAGYPVVSGNLTINGSVTSLDGLQCLTTIEGSLVIGSTDLVTLDGLNSLETINSSLFITSNESLEDILSGLESLTTIGGFMIISDNPNLPASQVDDLTGQLVDYSGGWF